MLIIDNIRIQKGLIEQSLTGHFEECRDGAKNLIQFYQFCTKLYLKML